MFRSCWCPVKPAGSQLGQLCRLLSFPFVSKPRSSLVQGFAKRFSNLPLVKAWPTLAMKQVSSTNTLPHSYRTRRAECDSYFPGRRCATRLMVKTEIASERYIYILWRGNETTKKVNKLYIELKEFLNNLVIAFQNCLKTSLSDLFLTRNEIKSGCHLRYTCSISKPARTIQILPCHLDLTVLHCMTFWHMLFFQRSQKTSMVYIQADHQAFKRPTRFIGLFLLGGSAGQTVMSTEPLGQREQQIYKMSRLSLKNFSKPLTLTERGFENVFGQEKENQNGFKINPFFFFPKLALYLGPLSSSFCLSEASEKKKQTKRGKWEMRILFWTWRAGMGRGMYRRAVCMGTQAPLNPAFITSSSSISVFYTLCNFIAQMPKDLVYYFPLNLPVLFGPSTESNKFQHLFSCIYCNHIKNFNTKLSDKDPLFIHRIKNRLIPLMSLDFSFSTPPNYTPVRIMIALLFPFHHFCYYLSLLFFNYTFFNSNINPVCGGLNQYHEILYLTCLLFLHSSLISSLFNLIIGSFPSFCTTWANPVKKLNFPYFDYSPPPLLSLRSQIQQLQVSIFPSQICSFSLKSLTPSLVPQLITFLLANCQDFSFLFLCNYYRGRTGYYHCDG
ncbi:hypothetical protein VP01_158g3 [Puccinia sorghi]|uniref:Uncharacterized protein n=1 Tax=Puccinia sorghi TaxID=27349 RepID=A0A0L6VHP3_9BASI|nr:hypothetical protein VP01_158g3 [Puccinia sorghi]